MDYLAEQPKNPRKAVIIASVALMAVAALVVVVLIVRNAALPSETPIEGVADGTSDGAPVQPGTGGRPSTSQPGLSGATTTAVIVEDTTTPVPDELKGETTAPPPAPGINRPLTEEEKRLYGFELEADIWMVTTRPNDGSPPETSFETRSAAEGLPPDGDNDGLSDADESIYRTDPKKADTDSDGATDGDEVRTYMTDPLKPDTDGDGVNDHDEAENGTDPLKP